MKLIPTFWYGILPTTLFLPLLADASLLRPDNTDTLFNRQQQQQQAQQQQFEAKAPNVSLLTPTLKNRLQFPDENPCFNIEQVSIAGTNDFPNWLPIQLKAVPLVEIRST